MLLIRKGVGALSILSMASRETKGMMNTIVKKALIRRPLMLARNLSSCREMDASVKQNRSFFFFNSHAQQPLHTSHHVTCRAHSSHLLGEGAEALQGHQSSTGVDICKQLMWNSNPCVSDGKSQTPLSSLPLYLRSELL